MSIARNIKIIRKKWRMNQTEFGTLINASQFDISSYEKKKYEPKTSAVIRIEEMTGIPVARLYGELIDTDEVPVLPLQSYTSDDDSTVVAESPAAYQKKETKEEDLMNFLTLVETVKSLQGKVEQLTEQLKNLQQPMED